MFSQTAHTDTFTRDNLPAQDTWPDFSLDNFNYPDRLNAAYELTDAMVNKGYGDRTAVIGNGRRRTYKELTDWSNRITDAGILASASKKEEEVPKKEEEEVPMPAGFQTKAKSAPSGRWMRRGPEWIGPGSGASRGSGRYSTWSPAWTRRAVPAGSPLHRTSPRSMAFRQDLRLGSHSGNNPTRASCILWPARSGPIRALAPENSVADVGSRSMDGQVYDGRHRIFAP